MDGVLVEHFKDWQPPKAKVEVPQFVADWFDIGMFGTFSGVISSYAFNDCEAVVWAKTNGGIDLLCNMKLYSYTVKKEPKFSLVNKITGEYLVLLAIKYRANNENIFDNSTHFKKEDLPKWKPEMYRFTEVEIASMETGSYKQIEADK